MKILAKIPNTTNPEYLNEQLLSTLYPLSDNIVKYINSQLGTGNTVVLFSGGFCLPWVATYIEAKMFQLADVKWKPNTLFVDPSQSELKNHVIKCLKPQNLLILNTNIFLKYRPWHEIDKDIDYFKTTAGKVIVTAPLTRIDFNRLQFSNQDIASMMKATILEDTLIICR
jgi:hypothetical protein